MPLKHFNLSFEQFRIVSLSFSINETYRKRKTIPINTQIRVAHEFDKSKKQLTIRLKTSSIKGNIPFYFEIEGEGVFVFDKSPDKDILEKVANINGPAIIFPYIRETIADLTRRSGFKPLHLPPIDFVKLAEGQIVKKAGSLKKTPKKPKK